MTATVLKATVQQLVGEKLNYVLNLRPQLEYTWKPNKDFANNAVVRPPLGHSTGFDYQATGGGGRTSQNEPRWPTNLAGTVQDGSILWTAIAPTTTSIDQLTGAAPTITVPAGITVTAGAIDVNGEITVLVDSTASIVSSDYDVYVLAATNAGQLLGCELTVQVRS